MPAPRSAPIIERRSLASKRFTAKPDDLAEPLLVIATMRDVPREALESFPDMLHLLRRLSGRLNAIAGRLAIQEELKPMEMPRTRLAGAPATDRAAVAAGIFGHARPRPSRETKRMVANRKGKLVRVVERPSRQMELSL